MSQISDIERVVKLLEERGFVRAPTKDPAKRFKMPSYEKIVRLTYPGDISITAAVYAYSTIVYQARQLTRGESLHALLFKPTSSFEALREGLDRLLQEGVLKPVEKEALQGGVR